MRLKVIVIVGWHSWSSNPKYTQPTHFDCLLSACVALAKEFGGIDYIEVSAFKNDGVNELFDTIVKNIFAANPNAGQVSYAKEERKKVFLVLMILLFRLAPF